jgi:hypothetical protein
MPPKKQEKKTFNLEVKAVEKALKNFGLEKQPKVKRGVRSAKEQVARDKGAVRLSLYNSFLSEYKQKHPNAKITEARKYASEQYKKQKVGKIKTKDL